MEPKDTPSGRCFEQVFTMVDTHRRSISTIAALATLSTPVLVLVLWTLSPFPTTTAMAPSAQPTARSQPIKRGLCVVGCTPYVDPSQLSYGIKKYWKLVEEMADTCQVIVHVGDTKPGACKRAIDGCFSIVRNSHFLRFFLQAACLVMRTL
jgi:hypothetical protein